MVKLIGGLVGANRVKAIFNWTLNIVFSVMIAFLTFSIIIGMVRMFMTVGDLFVQRELASDFQRIISDVLTLFILIELSRSLVEYFNSARLRMTFIVDAAIVFVLREVMIQLFEHQISPVDIYAMSALLLVLTALRIGSIMVYQRGIKADTEGGG
ncbi:MAG: phosphate-starvation-inducible PsiE family protein [Chromatiales bacterium]|jgi:uncharacterized membrane protein (DUF373 family)|nr:phosphate-starvation-inducible PsiE family protein [Chromatiales bacterium]